MMVSGISRSLATRIRSHYENLPPSERRVADLILNFPNDISGYSAGELALMAKTSNPAVSRFVQRIGFQNYDEMRRAARDNRASSSLVRLAESALPAEADFIQPHLEASERNITATFERISRASVVEMVEALRWAQRVCLLGFRHSFFLASYARWQLMQVRGNIDIAPAPGETLAENLVNLSRQDLIIVFGLRDNVPAVRKTISVAQRRKIPSILIGDETLDEDIRGTWTVRCETRNYSSIDNHTSVLIFISILAERLLSAYGADGRRRLTSIEELHEELDEL